MTVGASVPEDLDVSGGAAGAHGGPRASARTLRLLAVLAEAGPAGNGMTLSELAQALTVSKSTLLSSLRALAGDGFLICDAGRYLLGPGAYRLAASIMAASSNSDSIWYFLRRLAAATTESVGFAIADWDIGQTVYTHAINSTQPVHYAMRVGIRTPLYAGAAGRVLMAYAPAAQTEAYLQRGPFRALTPTTRTTPDAILDHLETIRSLGYCASFGEMLRDTAAVAVPVFAPSGQVAGAIIVAAPLERIRSRFDTILAAIVDTGRQASGLPPRGK